MSGRFPWFENPQGSALKDAKLLRLLRSREAVNLTWRNLRTVTADGLAGREQPRLCTDDYEVLFYGLNKRAIKFGILQPKKYQNSIFQA